MNKPACPKHDTGGGPCYCPPAPEKMNALHAIDGGAAQDSREHQVAVLVKAALDAVVELDWLKKRLGTRDEQIQNIVERVYDACEALGVRLEDHEVAA